MIMKHLLLLSLAKKGSLLVLGSNWRQSQQLQLVHSNEEVSQK